MWIVSRNMSYEFKSAVLCCDNSNYSANTIHSPIYSVNNIFNCLSIILATIIRILFIGMDVLAMETTVICQG